ncbi:MAG TPA: carbonic anhydrase family protein [Candidatus Eisenbacteria bacterium]|nr:carbonic anhydrase family protein [Candidatus Eisenbacteria bacterium]
MRIRRPTTAALLVAGLLQAGCASHKPATPAPAPTVPALTKDAQAAITPAEALQRLRDGNARFVAGTALHRDLRAQVAETSGGQYPFASVLGCIDSRVPPELVFDQGIGDIFSARIAGNFVDPDLLGSLEFASKVAGSKLILVLGHTECGAIKGACDDVKMGNLTTTLAQIRPAVAAVRGVPGPRDSKNKAFVEAVTRENVTLTMQAIRHRSPILRAMIDAGEVGLAGGIYDVKTGAVAFVE